jgi:hypothetical protein
MGADWFDQFRRDRWCYREFRRIYTKHHSHHQETRSGTETAVKEAGYRHVVKVRIEFTESDFELLATCAAARSGEFRKALLDTGGYLSMMSIQALAGDGVSEVSIHSLRRLVNLTKGQSSIRGAQNMYEALHGILYRAMQEEDRLNSGSQEHEAPNA